MSAFVTKLNPSGSGLVYSTFIGGVVDAYVAKLNPTGSALDFASFLGGSQSESGNDVALDPAGNVYVTGHTYSSDFTTTAGAFDRTWAGDPNIFWGDAFVAKISTGGTEYTIQIDDSQSSARRFELRN